MRARLLLDSELTLWALAAPARLSREIRELLDGSEVHVSAASILEIGLKSDVGGLAAEVLAALEPTGFHSLAVSGEHAALAAALVGVASDAVDRLLLAQAGLEGLTLLTSDAQLAASAATPARPSARLAATRAAAAGADRARVRGVRLTRRPRPAPPPAARCRVILVTAVVPRRRARA